MGYNLILKKQKTMIITRRIQIIPAGSREDKIETMQVLRSWRNEVRKAANAVVCHKFVQQHIAEFSYIEPDIFERFSNPDKNGNPALYAKDILKKEPGNSEQNSTYRIISKMLKGKIPSAIFGCLNQAVAQSYSKRLKDMFIGKASAPSYSNIPIPFPASELKLSPITMESKEGKTFKTYLMDFFHLPFELYFGKDMSGNRTIVHRALEGQYKICTSSIFIKDANKERGTKEEIYLLLCLDIPKKIQKLDVNKILYASLSPTTPIVCSTKREKVEELMNEQNIDIESEKKTREKGYKRIGNSEEFLHRRIQIQNALHAAQINARYAKGGHGRRKKLKAVDLYHEKEKNYVDYKTHVYSRILVNTAERNNCGTIVLLEQKEKEEEAKKVKILLRNWSYHDLQTKICYKADMLGIKVVVPPKKKEKKTEKLNS